MKKRKFKIGVQKQYLTCKYCFARIAENFDIMYKHVLLFHLEDVAREMSEEEVQAFVDGYKWTSKT